MILLGMIIINDAYRSSQLCWTVAFISCCSTLLLL